MNTKKHLTLADGAKLAFFTLVVFATYALLERWDAIKASIGHFFK